MIYLLYFLYVLSCLLLVAFFVFDIYLILEIVEYICCVRIMKQPPMVASASILREKVVQQINTYYPNAKNICDFGSGFGGLARFIAKNTKAHVYGLENMPFSVVVSKFADFIYHTNNKTIWCDAFNYMDKTKQKFDIVVAYLGPHTVPKLLKYKNKTRVLISLDFKLENIKPTRTIKVGYGYTKYGGKRYPNTLYIYEF